MTIDYDGLAGSYESRYRSRDFSELEDALARRLDRGERALEVGCGSGYWLERLDRWGLRATGLDPSRSMLRRAAARGTGVPLVRGRAESLPFRDGAFDRVLAIQVLHHLREPSAFASEARRVVRSGGGLLVIALDPSAGADRWYVYDYFEGTLALDRSRHPSSSQLRRWLEQAGFTACRTALAGSVRVDAPARELVAQGALGKESSSQLALLSPEDYRRGIERIERDISEAEARGETLRLGAELRYYATSATAP